jgi:hypothetical protein
MSAVYVLHALITAFRTARFDRHATGEFDHSFEGFFRSFFAAVLAAPFYFFMAAHEEQVMSDVDAATSNAEASVVAPAAFSTYLFDALLYALDWVAFPIAMIGVAKLIGASGRYVPYIVAYNWGTCVVMLATIAPYLLYMTGLSTATGFVILYCASLLFVLAYRWRLAKDGLGVTPVTAGGIVAVDVLLSTVIVLAAVRIERLL